MTFRTLAALAAGAILLAPVSPATAANAPTYHTSNGANAAAQGVVVVRPDGTFVDTATPQPMACVSGCASTGGDASAANQASQITQETAVNTVLGLKADSAWSSGSGSAIAILKAIAGSAAAATPAGTNVIGHVIVDTAPSTAVTGTFWQATQPVSLATAPVLVAGSAIVGKVGIDQTTDGTTNAVHLVAGTAVIGHVINDAGSAVIGHVIVDTAPSTAVTNAGTFATQAAQSGTWTVQPGNTANTTPWLTTPTPSSASGAGVAPVVSTAAEACHVLKASAGNLYGVTATTTATATANDWIMMFNATSAPADGTVTPVEWGHVSASGQYAWAAPTVPMAFSTGIVICLSTTGPFTKTAEAQAVFSGKVQ
jgi:hypothetical protein